MDLVFAHSHLCETCLVCTCKLDNKERINHVCAVKHMSETIVSDALDKEIKVKKRLNRELDFYRRACQIECVVVVVVLIIGLFVSHPVIEHPNTKPIVCILVACCIGYGIALEFARGSFTVVLFLTSGGGRVFCFGLGFAVAAFHFSMSL